MPWRPAPPDAAPAAVPNETQLSHEIETGTGELGLDLARRLVAEALGAHLVTAPFVGPIIATEAPRRRFSKSHIRLPVTAAKPTSTRKLIQAKTGSGKNDTGRTLGHSARTSTADGREKKSGSGGDRNPIPFGS